MHHNLVIKVQHSPFGPRVTGPDPDRTCFVGDGHNGTIRQNPNGQHVWSSPELDVYVRPAPDGAEIRIVYKTQAAQAAAKAA
jgi:hypothetical protein